MAKKKKGIGQLLDDVSELRKLVMAKDYQHFLESGSEMHLFTEKTGVAIQIKQKHNMGLEYMISNLLLSCYENNKDDYESYDEMAEMIVEMGKFFLEMSEVHDSVLTDEGLTEEEFENEVNRRKKMMQEDNDGDMVN